MPQVSLKIVLLHEVNSENMRDNVVILVIILDFGHSARYFMGGKCLILGWIFVSGKNCRLKVPKGLLKPTQSFWSGKTNNIRKKTVVC